MMRTRGTIPNLRSRRGTILVVTIAIVFTLAGLAIVFARTMRVEVAAAANDVSLAQASAIERGAEQYVLELVEANKEDVLTLPEEMFYGVQVGEGFFWIIRPNYGDPDLPIYGLVDEASKINLNTAPIAVLEALPWVEIDLPPAIVDWRDSDEDITSGGAENEYYMSLARPYYCKNAPLETVEELLLIRGATPYILFGQNAAGRPNGAPLWNPRELLPVGADYSAAHGLFDYVTVYSAENAQASSGSGGGGQQGGQAGGGQQGSGQSSQQIQRGLININTAPRDVLLCLGLEEADVTAIISARASANLDRTSTAWVTDVLGPEKAQAVSQLITVHAYQFSADIVAVSGNGRAFKRVRIVVDARTSPAKIVYRKDMTESGWPMEPELLVSLRGGSFTGGILPGGGSVRTVGGGGF